jgi:hypothetical protein
MEVLEIIRTVDGFISVGILLYIYIDMRKEIRALNAYLQETLRWFLGRTDIPK